MRENGELACCLFLKKTEVTMRLLFHHTASADVPGNPHANTDLETVVGPCEMISYMVSLVQNVR